MESAIANTIVRALQELKVATYDSIRWFDRTYTVDSYKYALWGMETKEQVKRKVFQAGKNERYVWFLPWYEDDANEKIEELEQDVVAYLDKSPSTSGELRQYFRESYPAYHQVAYLALRVAVGSGRVAQHTFNDGRWKTIYYLPEKRDLENLEVMVLQHANDNGFAFAQDISDAMKISRSLAYALLAKLANEGKIIRFKVAWNYARNVPIFAYCKEGYEARAVARFHQLAQERQVQRKRDRLVEDYLSKFKNASVQLKADESLADLASSYFERLLKSGFIRGRETAIVAWSAYFLASKILKQGITPGDIESYGKLGKTPLPNTPKRGKIRKKTLLLNTVKDANDFLELSAPDLYSHPVDYLEKIVGKMKLTEKLVSSSGLTRREELRQETANFISEFPKQVFFGKRSESLAAAALYMIACRLGVVECTQHRIAEAADVTDVTLRNTMHSIVAALRGNPNSKSENSQWMESLASEDADMKAKGLVKYIDKQGKKKWGTPGEVEQWKIQDALAHMFSGIGAVNSTKEEERR